MQQSPNTSQRRREVLREMLAGGGGGGGGRERERERKR